METTRQERRGKIQRVWNETFKRLDTYRLSTRGKWIMVNNLAAEQLSKHQMNKLVNN